jgi:hypothetical protein
MNNQFHDDESDDIYDLYNACNGVVLTNGALDTRKLDEISQEERDVLDVSRLRRIADHVASGCAECQRIIDNLNLARRLLSQRAGASGRAAHCNEVARRRGKASD